MLWGGGNRAFPLPTPGSCKRSSSEQRTRYHCMDQADTEAPRLAVSGSVPYLVQPFPGPPKLFRWPPRQGDGQDTSWEWTGRGSLHLRNAWTPLLSVNAETGKVCFALFCLFICLFKKRTNVSWWRYCIVEKRKTVNKHFFHFLLAPLS